MQYIQEIYMTIFQEDIPELIEDNVIPQLTTGLTQEMLQTNIMPNRENKNIDPSAYYFLKKTLA